MVPLIAGGTANVAVKCANAVDNGEYPNLLDNHNVFNNDGPDGSFGVASPIFLDNRQPTATFRSLTEMHTVETTAVRR